MRGLSVRTWRVVGAALGAAAASACASLGHTGFGSGTIDQQWPIMETTAQTYAMRGEFAAADSVLAEFALHNPGTPEALETAYWRAVFKLDPTNKVGSVTTAIADLDGYLADPRPREHVAEAMSLRRVAGQVQSLTRAATTATSQARDAANEAASAKAAAADAKDVARADASANNDAEIKRLRDELAKANAELDRIKKRLATPPRP